jgi:hypothetical protein
MLSAEERTALPRLTPPQAGFRTLIARVQPPFLGDEALLGKSRRDFAQ